jgi:phage/plasmid-like protein (TIGR03299 family)
MSAASPKRSGSGNLNSETKEPRTMSHGIETTDRFGEVGKKAWHGLGIEIPDGLNAQDGFQRIGLGWRTILAPVYAEVDVMGTAANGDPTMVKQRIEIPEKRAHFRADDMTMLGVVSDGYRPLENMDLARFADALCDAEQGKVIVETAGSLHSGRRVFACVRLPEEVRATEEDVMKQYVLVSNGHGGFASFSCYPTSVRVVCANTLRWSESDLALGLRFFHLGSMEDKLKNARTALGIARKETQRFQEQVTALVGRSLTTAKMKELAEVIYGQCFGKIDAHLEPESRAKLEAKRDEVVGTWLKNVQNERQTLKGIEGSAWALYNGISEWHDHERGRFGEDPTANGRISSNLFGVSNEHKRKAFRRILQAV